MKRVAVSILLVLLLFILNLESGCAGRGRSVRPATPVPEYRVTGTAPGHEDFATDLANLLTMPEDARLERRREAEAHLDDYRRFEDEVYKFNDSKKRWRFYLDGGPSRAYRGIGLTNGLHDLKAATELDPTFAEAWCDMGRLCAVVGDLHKGREYLDRAWQAAVAQTQAGHPLARDEMLEIHRQRAWVLRDLARWDEALDAVEAGLRFAPGDRDLNLIKGLVLAGLGRIQEATSWAVRMEPFSYPRYDVWRMGRSNQTSDYANRWIRSQALLAVGDYQQARHVLGDVGIYPHRRGVPHQRRFWQDVGLVGELAGDPEAPTYYAIALISCDYTTYYPVQARNYYPLVLDFPALDMPIFTTYGGRFLLCGSVLGYVSGQMNMMTLTGIPEVRARAAWRALEALNLAERRNIRPDVVRALRGRLYFAVDEKDMARRDLASARHAFGQAGQVDPGTSLLLGLLEMDEGHHAGAVPLLEESVRADGGDPVAWRSLGVCRAQLGQKAQARQAMDRALELDPLSVAGLYNRGLLSMNDQDNVAAATDLERAYRLDPDNHEVQRLLQMNAVAFRSRGGDPSLLAAVGDSLATAGTDLPSQEAVLARLEADIQTFFAVPDSLKAAMGPGDQAVQTLERQWQLGGDPMLRKVLALAYLDRGQLEQVQLLLGPGWGKDLSPEEEIMLLYADRARGEVARARELGDRLLRGDLGPDNPYWLTFLPQQERKQWWETILKGHFYEIYGAANGQHGDLARYSRNMRHGYVNLRQTVIVPGVTVDPMPMDVRLMLGEDGYRSATSGFEPVSPRMKGNVQK